MILSFAASLLVGSASLVADPTNHAVTFTATATGVDASAPVEFVFAKKDSDRDYESLFLVDTSPSEFAKAFDKAGIPRGDCIDPDACRLWPTGPRLTLEPALTNFLSATVEGKPASFDPMLYAGGARDKNGVPIAETDMPGAVFATYDLPQSLVSFDGVYPQGQVYGRYLPVRKIEKGTKQTFTFRWDGKSRDRKVDLHLSHTNLLTEIKRLRDLSAEGPLDVLVRFDPNLTIDETVRACRALAEIDSPRIKLNGFDGVFYRAFLPLEKWRDRSERLAQPVEIHLGEGGTNTVVEIREDWSGEGIDPVLEAVETRCRSWKETADAVSKIANPSGTIFAYLAASSRVRDVLELLDRIPSRPKIFYVFTEERP